MHEHIDARIERQTPGQRPTARSTTVSSRRGHNVALLNLDQETRVAKSAVESRRVEVGAEVGGAVQVLSGLREGEEVVTEGALFWKPETRSSKPDRGRVLLGVRGAAGASPYEYSER